MAKIYRVTVEGMLDEKWADWFTDMTIEYEAEWDGSPITTLTGPVADQPRLRGILSKIWDLNLTLVSVTIMEPGIERLPSQEVGEGWENS